MTNIILEDTPAARRPLPTTARRAPRTSLPAQMRYEKLRVYVVDYDTAAVPDSPTLEAIISWNPENGATRAAAIASTVSMLLETKFPLDVWPQTQEIYRRVDSSSIQGVSLWATYTTEEV